MEKLCNWVDVVSVGIENVSIVKVCSVVSLNDFMDMVVEFGCVLFGRINLFLYGELFY